MPAIAPTAYEFRSMISQLERVLLEVYLPSTHSCREPILPSSKELELGTSRLLNDLPQDGVGLTGVTHHLASSLLPAFNDSSISPHYYGFVTGGSTPAALLGDFLATIVDQNVQVHLPQETLATTLENRALEMLLDLFRLSRTTWQGRAFTTGCTAANILGLMCGREALLRDKLVFAGFGFSDASIADMGILEACLQARVMGIQVLSAAAHSSVAKAAAVVGIGRNQVKDIGLAATPWEFDMVLLGEALADGARKGVVSILVVGYGEVNTGRFVSNLRAIRTLVNRYGSAWIHVDAAFGIFARVFSPDARRDSANGMSDVALWAADIEYADSIAGDGHKLLNVPYDCGFFYTRTSEILQQNLRNAAPYLAAPPITNGSGPLVPSPLNTHLENSRRFRALPVYSTLVAYGARGYRELVKRLVLHAREIARVVYRHPAFELLPREAGVVTEEQAVNRVFMVVLFRAKDEWQNQLLKERINDTGRMYVSPTVWDGKPAVRCAVGNWRVSPEKNGPAGWGVVEEVLQSVGGML
ncbi:pyridoxal phosphate-dependent transferase [Tricharina praecox]|uniref:pyridoxal phosphate-dependent transferase n=1 Tax=Tricharina praecox TaxID=43433 RepID=UPI00221FE5A3|nr:pyridoxal phosphate-dependent transferase [Tricharina praecox]KAI5846782.1 pyridoxal phosphate-dependent transferase [Tricharina praecox]